MDIKHPPITLKRRLRWTSTRIPPFPATLLIPVEAKSTTTAAAPPFAAMVIDQAIQYSTPVSPEDEARVGRVAAVGATAGVQYTVHLAEETLKMWGSS